jgi:predicted nucleotidyltransferase
MLTVTKTQVLDLFGDSQGNVFKVLSIYSPNEEPDSWVEYVKESTGQKYSCRLEAFLGRFTVLPK